MTWLADVVFHLLQKFNLRPQVSTCFCLFQAETEFITWAHCSKPVFPERKLSDILGVQQQARIYASETRIKT